MSRRAAAVLAALAVLAIGAPGIGHRSLWLDEALTASRALRGPRAIVAVAQNDQNPPAYTLFLSAWVGLFGTSEAALRVPSLLAAAATAALLLLFVWRWFGGEAASYAVLLLAASEPHLYYAREARAYAVLGLLCVASYSVYLGLLERPTWRRALALAAVNALALYTHLAIGLAFVAQAVCALLYVRTNRRTVALYAASQLLAGAAFLPWLTALWRNLPVAGVFWLAPPDEARLWSVVAELAGGRAALIASLIAVAVFVIAALAGRTRTIVTSGDRRRLAVLAAWSVLPVASAFAVSQWIPVFRLRYELYASLGWFALLGAVLASLSMPRVARVAFALVIAAASASTLDWQRMRSPDWRRAAAFAVDTASARSAIVVSPSYQCLPFAYYADPEAFADAERTLERLARRRVACVMTETEVDLDRLGRPDRVITLVGADAPPDLAALPARIRRAGYQPAGAGDLGGIAYAVFRRPPRPHATDEPHAPR
jgi:mannosyltransferase